MLLFSVIAFSSCDSNKNPPACSHNWSDATCTEPKTCTLCKTTEGEALGHTWVDADCVTPKTCSFCAATEGEALGHTWVDADCVTPKTCSVCATTEGEALGHTWVDADCVTAKTCSVCATTEGEALGHTWVDADCVTPKTCSVCAATEGEALGHTWVDADCVTPKTCSVCKATEGEALGHSNVNGKCTVCNLLDEAYCQTLYAELLAEMLDLEKDDQLASIKEKLDSLPSDYKDVADIKNEYIFINAQYKIMFDAVVNDILKQMLPDNAEKYYINYANVRRAYLNLINNADKYSRWNLIGLANDYFMGKNDAGNYKKQMFFIMVGEWTTSDGDYWFDVIENEDNSLSFRCNLPNNKVYGTTYYYDINGRNIGYAEGDSEEVSFNAYRIEEVGTDFMKIFCYKNSTTYTFYK